MLNFLKNILKPGGSGVIGIDIGPSSVKVVQLHKQNGRAILDTYGALALGPYANVEVGRATNLPPQKIAEAIVDLLRESGTTTRNCGLSIPMSASLLTIIEVPAVSETQLAEVIPIEARKYIPIPISEVALDWWVIPKEQANLNIDTQNQQNAENQASPDKPNDKMMVLLVVIHNDAISQAKEIIRLANLNATFFEIEIFSTIRSVLDREAAPVMILDMGAGSTKLYIVDRGILRASHIITRGSQDITLAIAKAMNISVEQAELMKREKGLALGGTVDGAVVQGLMMSSLNYIFSEVNRVVLSYQKKYNKNVSKVLMTGGGSVLTGYIDAASKSLETPVFMADPFSKVQAPAFLIDILKQNGPEFSVAMGLALRKLQESQ